MAESPLFVFESAWEPAPRSTPPGAALFAVGDVHGHLAHLDAILALLRPRIEAARAAGRRAELVLVGDYVDRGPSSLGVLRRVAGLPAGLGVPVHALRGNHDQLFADFLLAESPDLAMLAAWAGNGGDTTLAELGVSPAEVAASPLPVLAARARAAAGEKILRVLTGSRPHHREGGYLFVHAGVHPDRSLADHDPREFLWLREPFIAGRGWRHPFTVVHGHTIRGPEVLPHRIGLDSGVYRTGVLTALEIADDRLRFCCVATDPRLRAFRQLPARAQRRRYTEPAPLREALAAAYQSCW